MKKLLTIATLALASVATQASDKLRYDYIDFGYLHSEGERTSDKTGYELNLSLAFDETWYVRTTLQSQSADVWAAGSSGDVSAKEYEIVW